MALTNCLTTRNWTVKQEPEPTQTLALLAIAHELTEIRKVLQEMEV